jgi:uncharacterized membrane protein
MSDTEEQERLVRWAYGIQWSALLFPPAILASLVYLLFIRNRITNPDIHSHVRWQLVTCVTTIAMVPIGFFLLVIGLSGVNTGAVMSIIATFALVGFGALFPLWPIYRLIRGTIRFSKDLPMEKMFP